MPATVGMLIPEMEAGEGPVMRGEEPPDRRGARGRAKEILVFILQTDSACAECGEEIPRHGFMRLEGDRPLCLECADLERLDFLRRGDPAVTRRASKHSRLRAVVLKWSLSRRRYERQGILAEPEAIRRAEEECIADAGERERRREERAEAEEARDREYIAAFARAVRERFPGCPPGEDRRIAEHACRKHSGRVGRTAAAKAFEEEAIRLAVTAHVRHEHTRYDDLLMEFGDRTLARDEVADEVAARLEAWRARS